MAKVTSKPQVTIPKRLAETFGIAPCDEIDWVPAGDAIRLVPAKTRPTKLSKEERLKLFDRATTRQREREGKGQALRPASGAEGRGWTREELYRRGKPR
jgi:AbrB family looped-hinge helix DNA binding protein